MTPEEYKDYQIWELEIEVKNIRAKLDALRTKPVAALLRPIKGTGTSEQTTNYTSSDHKRVAGSGSSLPRAVGNYRLGPFYLSED